MVNTSNPLAIYDIAKNLLDCVADKLADTEAGAPARRCVVTGALAWDDCECGQLAVVINRAFSSDSFPTEGISTAAGSMFPCGGRLLGIEYTVSILRCAPTGGDDPAPPTCPDIDAASQTAVIDAWAVRTAALCCLNSWASTRDPVTNQKIIDSFVINDQPFVGAEGMCMGSELNITVGIANACIDCGDS